MERRKISRFTITPLVIGVLVTAGCSDDGDDSSGPTFPSAGAEVGAYTINTSGGSANALGGSNGGAGGSVSVTLNDGMEGRLEILDNGLVDASFTPHTMSAMTGTNAATISADTTVAVVSAEPAADTLYMVSGNTRLYKSDGDGTMEEVSEVVTGLTIDSGATLTLELNQSGNTEASLDFTGDVVNNGTIVTADDTGGGKKGDLTLMAQNYMGGSASSIDVAGDSQTVVGGGSVSISTDYMIMNSGTVDASGFTDTAAAGPVNGGNAGSIAFSAGTRIYSTGALTAKGGVAGDATGNNGGFGGSVSLATNFGDLNNSAAIDTRGGNADVIPGDGGSIFLSVGNYGHLLNSGNLTTTGGTSQTDNGGSGGNVMLAVSGGDLKNSGGLTTAGGTAAEGFAGGNGGDISFSSSWGSFETMPGNILISGNLNAQGGSETTGTTGGGSGGAGGSISIVGKTSGRSAPQLIGLWGYTDITVDGGDGESGSAAGSVDVATNTSTKSIDVGSNIEWRTSGNVINEANVSAKGGDSTSTTVTNRRGGTGGSVTIAAVNTTNVIGDSQMVTNSGDITTSAGANHERTGGVRTSGSVNMDASGGVTNTGAIITTGGSDNDTTGVGRGNNAGAVTVTAAAGDTRNSAAITGQGGAGQFDGGNGANVFMMGVNVVNSGNIGTDGGDATATVANSTGGDAGSISFVAKAAIGISDTGTHTQTGGTGETEGESDTVFKVTSH